MKLVNESFSTREYVAGSRLQEDSQCVKNDETKKNSETWLKAYDVSIAYMPTTYNSAI